MSTAYRWLRGRGRLAVHRLDRAGVDLLMEVVVRIAEKRLLSGSRQSPRSAGPREPSSSAGPLTR